MAKLNSVYNRFNIGSFCSAKTLHKLELGSKALIISDCEGFEVELFDVQLASLLEPHDLLIELHDFVDITISSKIKKLFAGSHIVHSIFSIDDIQKAHSYSFLGVNDYSLDQRRILLAEKRPSVMEWVYLTSKNKLLNC